MSPPTREELDGYRARILEGLRIFGANYTEITQRFAASLGLHPTDAAALVENLYAEDRGVPLSPARLSERIARTSGATSALLNRLEAAGYITRSREHTDRRIVTLRSGQKTNRPARAYFQLLTDHMSAMVAAYSRDQLREFEAFLDHLGVTMDNVLAEQSKSDR